MNAEHMLLLAQMQIVKLKEELEAVKEERDEMLEVVREFVQTMDSLPDSNETSLRVWDVYDTASKLIEKMQRGES